MLRVEAVDAAAGLGLRLKKGGSRKTKDCRDTGQSQNKW